MKGRVLRLLLLHSPSKSLSSSLQDPILTNHSIRSLLPHQFDTRNRYSSASRRRGGESRDVPSEDHFLRNLNFGSGGNGDEREEQHGRRPMRGGRRDSISEDHSLRNLNFGNGGNGNKREEQQSQRPMRGERRTRGDVSGRFVRGDRKEGASSRQFFDFDDKSEERFGLSQRSSKAEEKDDFLGDLLTEEGEDVKLDQGFENEGETSVINKLTFGDVGDCEKAEDEEKANQDSSTQTSSGDTTLSESSIQDADAIFKKMKETGLIPNAVAMLDGLCKDGLVQEAMKLFGLMREKGTIPDVVIYTAVVEGFCKATKYDDAKRVFRKMQNNGIVPNAFSYTVAIQGLCKGKRWEDCIEFFLEMLDGGHSPNVLTFTSLVDGLCKDKGLEETEKIIRQLRERGFAFDEKTVREHMDKRGPFSPIVWEAIFGKKKFDSPF